jgi:hypothetical protein
MSGEQGLRGERGPRGDHGQEGHIGVTGDDGAVGDPGMDGLRGPVGLQGASAPRRHPALVVLNTITILCGLVIVGAAMWIAVDSARDENRLVADRDRLREQIAAIADDREQQRMVDACRHLFEADVFIRSGEYDLAEGHLIEAIAVPGDNGGVSGALAELETATTHLEDAIDALQRYATDPDPPGRCSHRVAVARRTDPTP